MESRSFDDTLALVDTLETAFQVCADDSRASAQIGQALLQAEASNATTGHTSTDAPHDMFFTSTGPFGQATLESNTSPGAASTVLGLPIGSSWEALSARMHQLNFPAATEEQGAEKRPIVCEPTA